MRHIGSISNERLALRFTDYLTTTGISAEAEQDTHSSQWLVWIHDEDRVDVAREELKKFLEAPEQPQYVQASSAAEKIRSDMVRQRREAARRTVEMRDRWRRSPAQRAPLVTAMIVVSVVCFVMTGFGLNAQTTVARALMFFDAGHQEDASWAQNPDPFVDIKAGQIWRALTPIFLHGSPLHILFNMYMLYQLGTIVESRRGPGFVALLAVLSGVTGNVMEMALTSTPVYLGGMSGVVYGLFGYLWIRSRLLPQEGIFVPPQIVMIMLGWMAMGFVLTSMHMANFAHLFGLLSGVAVAYVSVQWPRGRR
ncbi:MAG: rhomboid family intramembrane serine protease [Planctomycetales bacterium]|nr:rhomboid family intramembrane serine protease [Planctomycetales bacterium]